MSSEDIVWKLLKHLAEEADIAYYALVPFNCLGDLEQHPNMGRNAQNLKGTPSFWIAILDRPVFAYHMNLLCNELQARGGVSEPMAGRLSESWNTLVCWMQELTGKYPY